MDNNFFKDIPERQSTNVTAITSAIPEEVPQDIVDAEFNDYGESTYAKEAEEIAASLNEDDELPPYSVYARLFHSDKPVKYQRLACGHKFRHEFEPNHRNCELCWFTYFNTRKELVKTLDEVYQAGGPSLLGRLASKKFIHNWRKFMATVAFVQAQQEAAKKVVLSRDEAIEKGKALELRYDESTTGRTGDGSAGLEREDPWESPAYIGGGPANE